MSMNLTGDDLIKIAKRLDDMVKFDLDVVQFRCANHTIFVNRVDNEDEGDPHYAIRGITNAVTRHGGINLRDDGR